MPAENLEQLRRVLLGRLESLQRAGVLDLPRAARRHAAVGGSPPAAAEAGPTEPAAATHIAPKEEDMAKRGDSGPAARKKSPAPGLVAELAAATAPEGSRASPASAAPTLEVLQQEVAGCTRCGVLAPARTQTVFGAGNLQARLCFLGEAPGADEDRLGEPFVGRAGQLLTKIIEACQLKREDVYILNMLKCRPPGNRNPLPDELANCRPFLDRQLALIAPEFICCLGAVASQNLLGTTTPIGRLRGRVHHYGGAKVVCTFHPAYLLRNPAAKKETWEDMKLLMREMGVEL